MVLVVVLVVLLLCSESDCTEQQNSHKTWEMMESKQIRVLTLNDMEKLDRTLFRLEQGQFITIKSWIKFTKKVLQLFVIKFSNYYKQICW